MTIFRTLGIARDADETAIKRAYSSKIKQYRPDSHPAEFARIREAYEEAVRRCRARQEWADEDEELPDEGDVTFAQITRVRSDIPAPADTTQTAASTAADPHADAVEMMMAELESQADHDTEEGTLQRYRPHSAELARLPLDQQMDYERALCYWLLFSENPKLLVFLEASKRYGWEENSMEIVRAYGDYAGVRFATIRRLAGLFAEARINANPFLRLDGQAGAPPPLVAKHYSAFRAKEQSAAWQRECAKADLEQLLPRLEYASARPWQLFWVDFVVGLLAAGYGWLFVSLSPVWNVWLEVCLIGILFTLLPAVVRSVAVLAGWKLRGVIAWYENWRGPAPMESKSKWLLFPVIIGSVMTIGFLVGMRDTASFGIYLLAATLGSFLGWQVYKVLASLEAWLVGTSIKLARFAAWLKTARQGQTGQGPSEWNRAMTHWGAKLKGYWTNARASVYWWVFIWIVLMQLMAKLSKS